MEISCVSVCWKTMLMKFHWIKSFVDPSGSWCRCQDVLQLLFQSCSGCDFCHFWLVISSQISESHSSTLEMWIISFSSILLLCECNLNKVPYAAQYRWHWHLKSSGMWELWRCAAVKGEAGPVIFRNPENPGNLLSFSPYQIPFISFWQHFPSGLPAASCHMIRLVLLCTVVGKHKK